MRAAEDVFLVIDARLPGATGRRVKVHPRIHDRSMHGLVLSIYVLQASFTGMGRQEVACFCNAGLAGYLPIVRLTLRRVRQAATLQGA